GDHPRKAKAPTDTVAPHEPATRTDPARQEQKAATTPNPTSNHYRPTHLAGNAVEQARDARSDLSDLAAQRVIAHRIQTRTFRGLRRAARLRYLEDRLDHLDMLVAAVLLLTYAAAEGARSDTGAKPDGLAGFLVAAANDVGTLSAVLAERSRGNHPTAQLCANVPKTISGSAAVLAQTVADALAALAASKPHPV
ncbi:hypothetical protein IV498_16945, partial [Paenarthrobacter sp. Z7-10]|uniref:hypothetical protein n=1 Tax=Paenarthrobacter sp. Z7-10 TaxID=2787635 RepID=UPI0022A8DA64